MGTLTLPVLGTVVVAGMAYWNGLLLSTERQRPANAIAGLLLTLIAICCVVLTPARLGALFAQVSARFVLTGLRAVDAFILAYVIFAAAQVLLSFARAETAAVAGRSDLAMAASWVNRMVLRGLLVVSVGYGVALLAGVTALR